MLRKVNERHSKKDGKKPFGTVTIAGRGKKLHHLLDASNRRLVAARIHFILKPAKNDSTISMDNDNSNYYQKYPWQID